MMDRRFLWVPWSVAIAALALTAVALRTRSLASTAAGPLVFTAEPAPNVTIITPNVNANGPLGTVAVLSLATVSACSSGSA